jgi:hypothetical protein
MMSRFILFRVPPGIRRLITGMTAFCFFVSLVAVFPAQANADGASTSCGVNSASNGDACTITSTDPTHLRIDQPFVAGPSYEYHSIVFQPGDEITLTAGGCVQTGGIGSTWKRFVNPTGSNSGFPAGLYWGWVTIPGAFFADNPLQPVTHVPFVEFASGLKHSFIIPKLGQATDIAQPMDLIIGYTDDNYGDNSYSNHDDGNNNQCALASDGGPAWVTVSVQHGVAGPLPAVHPKPFDLVPTGFDSNLLFKNPVWGWQVNHGSIDTDGAYGLQCGPLKPCTSQVTNLDRIGWDLFEIGGLCGGDPPAGHDNWFDVTYTGQIAWDEWDSGISGDDDYNMELTTPDFQGTGPSGVTSGNKTSVKLEFDSDETIDHFNNQIWWEKFHEDVDNDNRTGIDQMVKGHDAVVIGLMGVDAVHQPSGAEIHPVHVLAIRESAPGSIDPANDSWVMFARNWGNEGECGSQQHYLDANTITVDLPRPGNVPANATATLTGDNTFRVHGMSSGPAVHNSAAGVQVTFTLPNGSDKPWAAGELHLNWTGTKSAARPAGQQPLAATGPPAPEQDAAATGQAADAGEPEGAIAAIFNAMTPAQQQAATAMFAQLAPPATQDDETSVPAYVSSTAPALPTSVPAVSQAPDTISDQRLHAQFQSLCAATGGVLPTQPALCPLLNQPPVTMLSTTGGAAGPDGWLTTPVTATLTAYDASGSGINHTEYSYDNQNWIPYTGPVTLPDGIYTLAYRSQDNKANLESTRQHSFKIDTRAPAITINQPTPTQYPHSSILTLDYAVDDGPASGLNAGSGVASVTPAMDGATSLAGHGLASGQQINLLTEMSLGSHTFTVSAVDNVGHASSRAVTFTIIVTPDSIKQDVRLFFGSGDIKNKGLETSLLAKLDAAAPDWFAGDCVSAGNIYGAFINELQAQSGKDVTSTAAQIMIQDAQYLITACRPASGLPRQ